MINSYLDYLTLAGKMAEYHRAYHRDNKQVIPDEEYDALRKELIEWEEKYPSQVFVLSPTQKVGDIAPNDKLDEFRHDTPMRSVENALNAEQADKWLDRWKEIYGEEVEIVGEFKYDGMAVSLRYIDGVFTRALTRGDGEYGEDITRHASMFVPKTIPLEGIVDVRGEAVMKVSYFGLMNESSEKYANPRSAAAGLLNPKRTELNYYTGHLSFLPYDIEGPDLVFDKYTSKLEALKDLGFSMSSCFLVKPNQVHDVFAKVKELRSTNELPFDIDGMLFKINSVDMQIELGETNHHPLFMFAYKFPPVFGECKIIDVVFQVGRSGEIAPVAKITATPLMGVVVTSVNLHNEEKMLERNIAIGNTYQIYRSGDVIPHLGKLVAAKENAQLVKFPHHCPSCSFPIVKRGALYYCDNVYHCSAQKVAAIAYAVSRDVLNVDGLAEKTVKLMLDNGVIRCTADLFNLRSEQIAKLPGYTEYSANKLWYSLVTASKTSFDKFIMALGIKDVGKMTARALASRIFKRNVLFELDTPEKVLELKVPDIGKVVATNIANYFSDIQCRTDAEALLEVLSVPTMGEVKHVPRVSGKTFAFTGRFSQNKDVLENMVLAAGGFVMSRVGYTTDYLVVGDKPGSQVKRAKVLNVEPMDERTFLSFFENVPDQLALQEATLVNQTSFDPAEFTCLANGLYVGYHVEGSDTFELAGSIPLSMETLHDERPLFLSSNKNDWFPNHLSNAKMRLCEVHFEMPPRIVYTSHAAYQKVNPFWNEKERKYVYSKELKKLISQGNYMFSIGHNDKNEIPESFLMYPSLWVKDIIDISDR